MPVLIRTIQDFKEEKMGKYLSELKRASRFLGEKSDVIFVGQNAIYPGSTMCKTFVDDVPVEKRIELPLFENTQMGISIGLALAGYVPVSLFIRPNFLLYTVGILVNELDKIPIMTGGKVWPKMIIKTMNGSVRPLDPGVQHRDDLTDIFLGAHFKNIDVVRLDEPDQIFEAYKYAYERSDGKSTILVEWGDYYAEK